MRVGQALILRPDLSGRDLTWVSYNPAEVTELVADKAVCFDFCLCWRRNKRSVLPRWLFRRFLNDPRCGHFGAALPKYGDSISGSPSFQLRFKTPLLERTGLRPDLLQIEVTESVMLGGTRLVAETIDRFRAMGISMAIDDFGTGYSSLSYLPTLAFDVLKIDRSFVINLNKQPEAESMIRTLIALAHNFGMTVIVEGVESQEALALVKALGANEVQGFMTGRPTPNPGMYMLLPASL